MGQIEGQNELVVFDVSQAKVVARIPVPGELLYAAGAESAVIYSAAKQTLSRISLKTFETEQSVPLPGKLLSLVLGHASRGPLVVQWLGHGGPGEAQFLDLLTLQPHLRWNPPTGKFHTQGISVSANGRIFALSEGKYGKGATFLEIKNDQIRQNYWRGQPDFYQPSADGSAMWATQSGHLFDYRRGPVPNGELAGCTSLATSGPWFLSAAQQFRDDKAPRQVSLMMSGDSRPVATLEIPPPPPGQPAVNRFGGVQPAWLQFVPEAGIIVEVPSAARDHIVMHHCDVGSLLAQSTADFLFVASRPKAVVAPGSSRRREILNSTLSV